MSMLTGAGTESAEVVSAPVWVAECADGVAEVEDRTFEPMAESSGVLLEADAGSRSPTDVANGEFPSTAGLIPAPVEPA